MTYNELTNLQELITYLSDEQLQATIEWCRRWINPDVDCILDEELKDLLVVCHTEQMERKAYDYLTKDQLADLLGNDNAHYAWDGDDLYYLAHPDQKDSNY